MLSESYFKEGEHIYPIFNIPILFVLIGERGKEVFPFLQKVKGSMGDSLQIVQIAEDNVKIINSHVEFVNIISNTLEQDIENVLSDFVIPAMKGITYGYTGRSCINFVVNATEKEALKLEQISKTVYGCMEAGFLNDVECHYFCIADAMFRKVKNPKLGARFQTISCLEKLANKHPWVRMVYIVSDLNEQDVFLFNNMEKKYLALTLNTYIQAGGYMSENKWKFGFDPWGYADAHACTEEKANIFQALGCAPLKLDKDLICAYFKWQFMEYLKNMQFNEQWIEKEVMVSKETAIENVVKSCFDRVFAGVLNGADNVAYNGTIKLSDIIGKSNSNCLCRFYDDNLNYYIHENMRKKFFEQQRNELTSYSHKYEEEFIKAFSEGELNPFHMDELEQLGEKFRCDIKRLEELRLKERESKNEWLNKKVNARKRILFKNLYVDKLRRRLLEERMRFEREELLLEGQIRYLHMQVDVISRLKEIAINCRNVFEQLDKKYQNDFVQLKQQAFTYQKERFEVYYSEKIKDTLKYSMTEYEIKKLYKQVCNYMLEHTNNLTSIEIIMNAFLEKFWKQGNFKENLMEEMEERMKVSTDSNKNETLVFLYRSACEAHNVNLRVLDVQGRPECDVCCFMGPSDDEFINFLQRQKEQDSRVRVQIVEQLKMPVVLYYKFDISEGRIRI